MISTLILEENEFSKKALDKLKKLGPVYFSTEGNFEPREISIIVCRLKCFLNENFLRSFENLKFIASPTTGLNHIDQSYCADNSIKIISLKGHKEFLNSIQSTSELALALIFNLIRNVPQAIDAVKKGGDWERDSFKGREFQDLTLGIMGYGRLGKQMGRYAEAFRATWYVSDPYLSIEEKKSLKTKWVSEKFLFQHCDIVSVHIDYCPERQNLIGWGQFKRMKPGSYFVNTSRGELVDERALIKALDEKILTGVALDVISDENDRDSIPHHPIIQYAKNHSNCFVTPHIGGCTSDAMLRTENYIINRVIEEVKNL